jgi:glycosyltransferase involved in cell wall biosynthesis
MKISLCIITQNEEANLRRCLESCAGIVDEVVVVDSGSSDGTEEIAAAFGARFVSQPWLGFVGQKNRALELASHDWVLSLDADEALSAELAGEIAALKRASLSAAGVVKLNEKAEIVGYSMPRCVLYEGRWIRHGDWYPDRLARLFVKSRARFAGGKVHERLEIQGRVEPLRGEIFHYSFRSRADHWERCQTYARLWAETQFESGRRAGPWAPWSHAFFRWIRAYGLRRGFLDGRQGWWIARFAAGEVFLKYRLLAELWDREKQGPNNDSRRSELH